MSPALRRASFFAAMVTLPIALLAALPKPAGADVVHLVSKGEKIADVAKKYGVTPKALAAANKIKEGATLKAGQKLVVPVTPSGGPTVSTATKSATFVAAPKTPGHVTLLRLGSKERLDIQLVSKKGKLVAGVLPRVARMMRFVPLNIEHQIDAQLVERIAKVSDHFGGRAIEIVSGFRPKTPTQYTPHSNHNVGKAIDMRIPGVPNEVLRDYCRTFKSAGVGYYPNSLFVHFDVRSMSTFWIDLSRPGEKPVYVGAIPPDIDHSVDDTASEGVDLKDEAMGASPGVAGSAKGPTVSPMPSAAPTPPPATPATPATAAAPASSAK